MNPANPEPYDVLIMGAGIVGLCQARHLLLKTPGLRIGMVDPKGLDAESRDLKVGESLVEISAMFLYRELELQEYLIENHPPKYGLNFHWPKRIEKTATLDDYYHVWTNGSPDLPSYQINRAKFEADLLRMNIDMGVEFLQGKVVDVEINPGSERNKATVRTAEGEMVCEADHLVDAASRKFLISKKLDNLVTDSRELVDLETGSAWLRVAGVDRDIFQARREETNGQASHWYGTNHFFGHGHWIWMIPIEREDRTLSIGVVHHREMIENASVNSREKFLEFLEANHKVVYDMVKSGEILDFKYLPKVAHRSRKMMSEDQWYVMGEAANMFDPFYSSALVIAAWNIELVTEIIRAKKAGEPDAEERRELYDGFILRMSQAFNNVYFQQSRHLGDAGAMTWRCYMEMMFWFGILIPTYVGKWHFERDYIEQFEKMSEKFFFAPNSFMREYYAELNRAQDEGVRLPLMDYTRADQLALGYKPTRFWVPFRENTMYEPRRLNVLSGIRGTIFYLGLLYAKLRIQRSGPLGLLAPATLRQLGFLAKWVCYTRMGEAIENWKMRRTPAHSRIKEQMMQFGAEYRYERRLVPWGKGKDGSMISPELPGEPAEESEVEAVS